MTINAIFACDECWGIGYENRLPWGNNKADLSWFRRMTVGSTVIMGRNTWDSLPIHPLPSRTNIVVTTKTLASVTTCTIDKIQEYLQGSNVFIIGGASLFTATIPYIENLWISRIPGQYNCDTFLPKDIILKEFYKTKTTFMDGLAIELWNKQ